MTTQETTSGPNQSPMPPPPIQVPRPTGRAGTVFVALAAAVLAALATALVLQSSMLPPSVQSALGARVEVPQVVGKSLEQSRGALEQQGLIPSVSEERVDPSVAAGTIVAQSPLPGWHIPRGAEIKLTVARGEGKAKVPDVAGLPALQAAERVAQLKLQLGGPLEAPSPNVPKGLAVGTMPPAGTDIATGALVRLVVSSGPPVSEVTVPKLTGLGRARALAALEQSGLKAGPITWVDSDDAEPGTVVRQQPAAGALTAPGTVITLSVVRDD